jgi:hypothetical protein
VGYERSSWLEADTPGEGRRLVFLRLLDEDEPFGTAQFLEVESNVLVS